MSVMIVYVNDEIAIGISWADRIPTEQRFFPDAEAANLPALI